MQQLREQEIRMKYSAFNTTALPVIVTYVYTLTANGCIQCVNLHGNCKRKPNFNTYQSERPAIWRDTVFSYTPTGTIGGTTAGAVHWLQVSVMRLPPQQEIRMKHLLTLQQIQ